MFTDYLTVIKTKHFGIWEIYILNNFKLQIRVKYIALVLAILISHLQNTFYDKI
jgi:hypothetical protein